MSERYPISVRRLAKYKASNIIRHMKKKGDMSGYIESVEVLVSILENTKDSWLQRNVAEVLVGVGDVEVICRVIKIMYKPHIYIKVKDKIVSQCMLLIKTGRHPCLREIREDLETTLS